MPYSLVSDGLGGLRAQYIPATGTLPGSTTGIKVDAAGNVLTQSEKQFAELLLLNGGKLPDRGDTPLPPVAEELPAPVDASNFAMDLELQKLVVERQVRQSKPDEIVDAMTAASELAAGTHDMHDPAIAPPQSYAEQKQREEAARRTAAQLGYVLAELPKYREHIFDLNGRPKYTKSMYGLFANVETPLAARMQWAGDLPAIEARLRNEAAEQRSRAVLDAERAKQRAADPGKVPFVRVLTEEQAHAESLAGRAEAADDRLARVEQANTELKAQLAALLAAQLPPEIGNAQL